MTFQKHFYPPLLLEEERIYCVICCILIDYNKTPSLFIIYIDPYLLFTNTLCLYPDESHCHIFLI